MSWWLRRRPGGSAACRLAHGPYQKTKGMISVAEDGVNRGSGALILAWAGFALVCALIWIVWGRTGWPIGSYWWDDLALAGAARAIQRGMTPTVDYWAPFIFSLYLKAAAQWLVGVGRAYLIECMAQAGIILLLLSVLLGRRSHSRLIWLAGAVAVLSALLPFNIGSVTQAASGYVAYCGAYNRLGDGLIALVLLLPAVRHPGRRGLQWGMWLATVLVLAWLLKVTVLQICVVSMLSLSWLQPGQGWWRVTSVGAALCLLSLACLAPWVGDWRHYWSALNEVAQIRLQVQHEHGAIRQSAFLFDNQIEWSLYLMSAGAATLRAIVHRQAIARLMLWFMGAAVMACAFTLTNFGDNGLSVLLSGLTVLMVDAKAGQAKLDADVSGKRQRMGKLFFSLLGLGYAALVAYYLGNYAWFSAQLLRKARPDDTAFVQARSPFWAREYPALKPDLARHVDRSQVTSLSKPPQQAVAFLPYVKGLDEAQVALHALVPQRDKSVYALDFPAYVFSVVDDYRIPKGSRPWLMVGHEIIPGHVPAAKELFADVDVLMVSKCSLSGGNRERLEGMFDEEIQRRWRLRQRTSCWDIYLPLLASTNSSVATKRDSPQVP